MIEILLYIFLYKKLKIQIQTLNISKTADVKGSLLFR